MRFFLSPLWLPVVVAFVLYCSLAHEGHLDWLPHSQISKLHLFLPAYFSILVVELTPPGLWISGHASSLFIHFDVKLSFLTLCNVEELFLTIENHPKESFALSARNVVHSGIIALASRYQKRYLAIGMASSVSCYYLILSCTFCFQVFPSMVGGLVLMTW